jgi:hypothetical protein
MLLALLKKCVARWRTVRVAGQEDMIVDVALDLLQQRA